MKDPVEAPAFPPKSPDCPRCGDMFYHPKTVIEDYRQRAAEWEDIAKRTEADTWEEALKITDVRLTKVCANHGHYAPEDIKIAANELAGLCLDIRAKLRALKESPNG